MRVRFNDWLVEFDILKSNWSSFEWHLGAVPPRRGSPTGVILLLLLDLASSFHGQLQSLLEYFKSLKKKQQQKKKNTPDRNLSVTTVRIWLQWRHHRKTPESIISSINGDHGTDDRTRHTLLKRPPTISVNWLIQPRRSGFIHSSATPFKIAESRRETSSRAFKKKNHESL